MLRFTSSALLKGLAFRYGGRKKSHYEILETNPSASQEEIKAKYYTQVKKYHPDVSKLHQDHIKAINEAYSVLSDPSERARYDRENGFTHVAPSEFHPYQNMRRGQQHQNYQQTSNEDERQTSFRLNRRMRTRSTFTNLMENFIIGMLITVFFILIFGLPSKEQQITNKKQEESQHQYGRQQFEKDFQNSLMRRHPQR